MPAEKGGNNQTHNQEQTNKIKQQSIRIRNNMTISLSFYQFLYLIINVNIIMQL